MSVIKMFGYETAQQTEYQTKKWATREEMQTLSSGDEQRDVILAKGATVAFYEDDKHWETSVSNNVFAFGGTGSGKTASFILPNLLNHHECCYVVTDTKGELLRRTGKGFEEDGYEVTVLDTVNPEQSAGYDPLRYVMDVEDIPTTVAAIMEGSILTAVALGMIRSGITRATCCFERLLESCSSWRPLPAPLRRVRTPMPRAATLR